MSFNHILRFSALGLAAVLASGCSIFGDDELTYKELQPINATVTPSVVWEASVGKGVGEYYSRLNPAVAGDVIVAADRRGVVQAFNRGSGASLWRVDVREMTGGDTGSWLMPGDSARIAGGLVANNERVFFGTENGSVIALSMADGSLIWRTEIDGEVLADPAVGEGYLVVNTTAGKLVGLLEESGEQQWTMDTEVPALSLRGTSAPTINSGGALFGTATGKLTVAVLNNGQQAWVAPLAVPQGATELQRLVDADVQPQVQGNAVYSIAYNGQVAAVELTSGRILWQREYASFNNFDLSITRLFLTDTADTIYALDSNDGVEIWSNSDLTGRQVTGPVRFGNYVVVGDAFGYLHFLDANTGEMAGRLEVGDSVYVTPVLAGDTLYVQLRDGSLLAVRI